MPQRSRAPRLALQGRAGLAATVRNLLFPPFARNFCTPLTPSTAGEPLANRSFVQYGGGTQPPSHVEAPKRFLTIALPKDSGQGPRFGRARCHLATST